MAIEWLQTARDILCKILNPPSSVLAIWLVLMLLKIEFIRKYLELNKFFLQYEIIINMLFLFLTIYITCQIVKWISEKFLVYKDKKEILKELDTLNKKEKEILKHAVSFGEKTIIGDINDPNLVSLVEKRILIKTKDGWLNERAYIISNFIWKKIKNDPRFN